MPYNRDGIIAAPDTYKRHVGIYAYRVSLLNSFVAWPDCELERLEKLEQLRALWHGVRIHIEASAVSIPPGIDTPEDLERTRRAFAAMTG